MRAVNSWCIWTIARYVMNAFSESCFFRQSNMTLLNKRQVISKPFLS
jgi:hypothetical protein